ncbi:mucin-7-like isoform X2 [Portunus trituberculatus]|nr:mucin-7-like isoform X2 [Portunus trituberculatus]
MWLRGVGEEVTFTPVGYTEEPCVLLPKASHQVTISDQVTVHVRGAAGDEEDKDVCYFNSSSTFMLPKGVLKVSCLKDKTQAEAEMLGAEESSSSAPSGAKPQSRGLDPPPTTYTPLHTTTTTAPPQSSQAPPTSAITLELPSTGSRAESLNTNLKTTAAPSSTKHPPLIDDGGMGTTLGQDTTEMPDSTTKHVIEDRTAETTHGSTTSPTPDSSSINNNTQDTGQTGKTPLLAKAHPPLTRNKNISVRELTVQSGGVRFLENTSLAITTITSSTLQGRGQAWRC